MEKQHKTELHTDHGLGVIIDLINPDTYKVRFLLCLNYIYFPCLIMVAHVMLNALPRFEKKTGILEKLDVLAGTR